MIEQVVLPQVTAEMDGFVTLVLVNCLLTCHIMENLSKVNSPLHKIC